MKKFITSLACIALASVAVGCSNGNNQETGGTDTTNETLVVYTNSGSNGRGEWLKEQAAENGFTVEVVDIPGGELADRIISEKNNSIADVILGLNNLEYTRIKNEDLLTKYEPVWKDEVDLSLGDPEGYYYPVVVQPLVLIGRQGVEMPNDWPDLAQPEYKDKYGIFHFGSGTAKTVLASIASRYPDPAGEYGVSEEGWEVVKGYVGNAMIQAKGADYISEVISDEGIDYVMMWGSGLIQNENQRDYTFQYMKPEIGVPFVTEQLSILSTSDKKETAEKFINWLGSADVQEAWSHEFGSIPANKKALENVDQEIKDFVNSVKPQDMDWDFIYDNLNQWVEKVELEYVQ